MAPRALRKELERFEPAARIRYLPRDNDGHPIPWFACVECEGEEPEYEVRSRIAEEAYAEKRCWLCGTSLANATAAFLIEPLSVIDRVTASPPSHQRCAEFFAQTHPHYTDAPHCCCVVWITKTHAKFFADAVWRFTMGEPTRSVQWYYKGRRATRDDVINYEEGGVMAQLHRQGDSPAVLHAKIAALQKVLPP